jgi:RNA polymerase sigma factor (sigma-70 family)
MPRVKIDNDKQVELIKLVQAGDPEPLTAILNSQNGLIRQIAFGFTEGNPGTDLEDLIQEGYLAVMEAVRYFDPARGFKFSTYAADCCRRRMYRWLQHKHNQPFSNQEPRQTRNRDNPLEQAIDPASIEQPDIASPLAILTEQEVAVVNKRVSKSQEDLGLSRADELRIFNGAKELLADHLGYAADDDDVAKAA